MKLQFQILMFMACLNVATGLAFTLALPGTEEIGNAQGTYNYTTYMRHFNSTDVGYNLEGNFLGDTLTFLGHLATAFSMLMANWPLLVDGFPIFLRWIGDNIITDVGGRTAFFWIANSLTAIYYILLTIALIEFVVGRYFTK